MRINFLIILKKGKRSFRLCFKTVGLASLIFNSPTVIEIWPLCGRGPRALYIIIRFPAIQEPVNKRIYLAGNA